MLDSLTLRSLLVRSQTPPAAAAPSTAIPPSSAAASKDRNVVWHRPGEAFCIGDVTITGGWVYVGETLVENPANAWSRRNAPGLINPKLKVASPPATSGDISPYTSYAELSPSQRGSYLRWLAGDRSGPHTPVGYVHLYFLGLEHRVVVDEPGSEEVASIAAEATRLAEVYADQGSLKYVCDRLAQALELKLLVSDAAALDAWRPPPLDAGTRQGFSTLLKLAIARKVVTGRPLDFELAMAGYLSLPYDHENPVNSIAWRTPEMFATLTRPVFARKYPTGLFLRDRMSSRLLSAYQTANYNLPNPDWIKDAFERLPDPQELNWRAMTALCAPVAERLEPYARYLGKIRHPDSLEGLLLLPPELRSPEQQEKIAMTADRLAALAQPVGAIPATELASLCIGSAEGWNLLKLRQVNDVVKGLGYALEPDPDLIKVNVKAEPQLWIFRADATATLPDADLELASLLLLALDHARSDDAEPRAGLDPWVSSAAKVFGVNEAHLPRLEAQSRRLSGQSLTASRLARAIEPLGPEDKRRLAEGAAAVVSRMGCQTQAVILALEKLYDALGIERRALYAYLHRRAAEGLAVVETASPSPGFAIPRSPSAARVNLGALDMARVQSIELETKAVSTTLAAIYEEEEACASAPAATGPVEAGGLDIAHETLLGELAARDAWSAADLEALCRRSGLMAAAAVEVLNDWAYERCGEPVLEDEGKWRVNRDILEAARRAGA